MEDRMNSRLTKSCFTFLVVLLSLILFCLPALSAEFTGDLTIGDIGSTMIGKISVKGMKYRFDLKADKFEFFHIVDEEKNIARAFMPEEKEYREADADGMLSASMDPIQGFKYTASIGEARKAGTETVSNYKCGKTVVAINGEDIMAEWVAVKLSFPIKIVNIQRPEKFMEIKNIKEAPVDDSLFEIPEGYTKWIDPSELPVAVPDWAEDIPSAPVMKPPFEKPMTAGDIIRVKPEIGKSLKTKATAQSDNNVVGMVIPFKDGKPLKEPSYYGNIAQKGLICNIRHETPAEADEFIIRAEQGSFTVITKHEPMTEKELVGGQQLEVPLNRLSFSIETRIINLNDGESVVTFDYTEGGNPVSEERTGPAKYRRIMLKEKLEVDKNTRSAYGDKMTFKVEKGKVLIKAGQLDTMKF
jgi:hypothetical protein